jgi:hypothetical protein
MKNHATYLHPHGGCTIAGCWGNPEQFLHDLFKSDFIHVVDQYTGSTANNRYSVARSRQTSTTPHVKPLTDADMLAIIHSVVLNGADDSVTPLVWQQVPRVSAAGTNKCFDTTYRAVTRWTI